jgi:hypothetical protein
MKTHSKALGTTILAVLMVASASYPALAAPSNCVMPQLNGGTGQDAVAAIDRDRQALLRYEACLEEEETLYQALSAGSPETTARQRQAAANLRRTLDAWQQTQRAAEEARLQRKGS